MKNTIKIKKSSLYKTLIVLIIAFFLIAFFVFFFPTNSSSSSEDAPFLGDKNAPVEIIEYSDYQCPFCRKFWSESYEQLKKEYIETGKAKLVFKDYPLGFHEGAIPYARATRCVRSLGGDDAYWEMHDLIFSKQQELDGGTVKSTIKYPGDSVIIQWADELGFDIKNCMNEKRFTSEIQNNFKDGSNSGVSGTPSFLINGELVKGAVPYATLKKTIDKYL